MLFWSEELTPGKMHKSKDSGAWPNQLKNQQRQQITRQEKRRGIDEVAWLTSSHTVAAAATSLAAFCAANSSACALVPHAVAALGLWPAKMKKRQRGLNPVGCSGEGRASCHDRPNESRYAHAFETKQTMGVLFRRLSTIWAYPGVGAATVWRHSRCTLSLLLLSSENQRTRKSQRIDSPCAGTLVHKKEFSRGAPY